MPASLLRGSCDLLRQLIELCRHHEVVARQARGSVGREFERRAPPSQLDLGMVELSLGDERRTCDESERVAKVLECELAAQLPIALTRPRGHLGRQPCRLLLAERGGSRLAGLTVLGGEL